MGLPVDTSGVTEGGIEFAGIRDFKKHLLTSKEQVARNLVSLLITFATGGEIEFADREEVERILLATEGRRLPAAESHPPCCYKPTLRESLMHNPISRRAALKASGVAIALPLLESMKPAIGHEPMAPPKRMVLICNALGLHSPSLFPRTSGTDYVKHRVPRTTQRTPK